MSRHLRQLKQSGLVDDVNEMPSPCSHKIAIASNRCLPQRCGAGSPVRRNYASIALGLSEAFNSGPGSNVSRGMFLLLSYYTANIFDKMIIAGAGSPGLAVRCADS